MKIIQTILMTLSLIALFGFVAQPALAANDESKQAACTAIGGTYSGGVCSTGGSMSTPQDIVSTVIQIFAWVVGAISVIMLIFAGLKYVTSGGDSNKIASAKNTIIYAVIGLILVALSTVIVNFVLVKTDDAMKDTCTNLSGNQTSVPAGYTQEPGTTTCTK